MPIAVWLAASSSSEGLITTAVEALTPAVPVLIVRLQDADEITHAGSIPVFGLNRNLSIGRGLAPLPNPE
jgi:hypothetical protein